MATYHVTRESAINVAKALVAQRAKDPRTPILKKMALNTALSSGGIEEIFDEVFGLGFGITADDQNPLHQQWLQTGAIQKKG